MHRVHPSVMVLALLLTAAVPAPGPAVGYTDEQQLLADAVGLALCFHVE